MAATPANVAVLVEDGNEVFIETRAGEAARMSDAGYTDAGARLVPDIASVYGEAEMVPKVKEILPPEYDLLRDDHVLFSSIHSAIRPEQTQRLLDATLVNAVKWRPGMRLVSRKMLGLVKPNSLIVDIDCEPNGAIETCRFATHDNPVYVAEGIRHYRVPNLPSAAAFTASHILSNATLRYARETGVAALRENHAPRHGLGFCKGLFTFKGTADAQEFAYTPPEGALTALE